MKDVDEKETKDKEVEEEEKEKKDKDEDKSEDEEDKEKDRSPKPRALHKTSSIFLRNLPPTVTKQEVEAMCRRYEGFLRSAIADPAPDRRWFRRGCTPGRWHQVSQVKKFSREAQIVQQSGNLQDDVHLSKRGGACWGR